MANKKIERRISIYINGKEVKNNLHAIGAEIGTLRGQLRHLTPGTEKFIKKSAELKKAQAHYADINKEIKGTGDVLNEAFDSGRTFLNGLMTGDYGMIKSGLGGIAGGVKDITKASLKFIATPIGAAIALLAGVGLAAKKWFDFNVEVEKSRQQIRELTNESGLLVDSIRIRSQVLSTTFEADQKKLVTTAKSMVKNLGISYDEAFDIIEDGAVRGKIKNDEYLDSLSEYPVQFKNAGFSAQEFANIIETGIDLSIYSDKLPDAIKEADLAIKEQSSSTKEALVNAFGAAFSEDLLKRIRTGETTTKDALAEIAQKSEEVNLNQQQQAQLTADLFKGAGEDAGGALKIFEALNKSLNEQKKPLTEIQKIQKDQLESNKELNGLYTQLFASADSGFGKMIAKGKLFATQVLIKILQYGVDVYNWFVDLNNESAAFSGFLSLIGQTISFQFKVIKTFLKTVSAGFRGLGTIVEGVFTLNPQKIAQGVKEVFLNTRKELDKFAKDSIKDAQAVRDAFKGGTKMDKISLLDYDDVDSNPTGNKKNSNTTTTDPNPELTQIQKNKQEIRDWLDQWEEDEKVRKEIEDLSKEEADQLKEELETEAKFNKMIEQASADKDLVTSLEEAKNKELEKIKDKWDARFWEKYKKNKVKEDKIRKETAKKERQFEREELEAKQQLAEAKRNLIRTSLIQLQGFVKQGSLEYKALFLAEKVVAAANVIIRGAEERAKIALRYAGRPVMQKTQLAISKIRTGVNLASIAGTTLKGFSEGGPTGNNVVQSDAYGGLVGYVHPNEYVIPAIQAQNPIYQPIIQRLESDRRELNGLPSEDINTEDHEKSLLTDAIYMLVERLNEPFNNINPIGDDEIIRLDERLKKLQNSRTNAKVST